MTSLSSPSAPWHKCGVTVRTITMLLFLLGEQASTKVNGGVAGTAFVGSGLKQQHEGVPMLGRKNVCVPNSFGLQHRVGGNIMTPVRKMEEISPTCLQYEVGTSESDSSSSDTGNAMWMALMDTEKWISSSLEELNQVMFRASRSSGSSETLSKESYAKKEMNFVCEMNDDVTMAVAGIFRRLREAREMAESHVAIQKQKRRESQDPDKYEPTTFRQTQVVVIPCNEIFSSSFSVFDDVLQRINQARRSARRYVLELDEKENIHDIWPVAVGCTHLHPQYGDNNPDALPSEEDSPQLRAYKEQRLATRKSPYPTIVVEVKAMPPAPIEAHQEFMMQNPPQDPRQQQQQRQPPMSQRQPPFGQQGQHQEAQQQQQPKRPPRQSIMNSDINKLEAAFLKSSRLDENTVHDVDDRVQPPPIADFQQLDHDTNLNQQQHEKEEAFYDSIGKTSGIAELTFATPTSTSAEWVANNDPMFHHVTSSFIMSNVTQVDAAFENIFSIIGQESIRMRNTEDPTESANHHTYIVMPNFLPYSSVNFEQFATEVLHILSAIPDVPPKLTISTYHSQCMERSKKSPHPLFVLEW